MKFEYDPNRNTLISFISYFCGVISYIISVEGMLIGDIILSGRKIFLRNADCSLLKFIPINTKINNIEYRKNCGSQLTRASGCFSKIVFKYYRFCIIKLVSGRLKRIDSNCIATLGIVFNFNFYLFRYKTAGLIRLKGFRPKVRGVAMNPVDHPYGGGEGKKSKKKICMSP
jgi:large subunit ribosomal protein L2